MGGMEIQLCAFLTWALDGGKWLVPRLRLLYFLGNRSRYPLYTKLGGPQSRSECCGEEKHPLPLPGIKTPIPGPSSPYPSSYTDRTIPAMMIKVGTEAKQFWWLGIETIWSEGFTATVFSGDQTCRCGVGTRCIRDCLHHQGLDVSETPSLHQGLI
jgi:hypothetical protein